MDTDVIETGAPATVADEEAAPASENNLTAEDLIEEVSIDGMCGVY